MSLDWDSKSDRLVCIPFRVISCMVWYWNGGDQMRLDIHAFKFCGSFWQKLLIGTADGGIKAWNVDAKRVVCDLSTTEAFPRFLLHILCLWILVFLGSCSYISVVLQCLGSEVQPCRTNFCFCGSIQRVFSANNIKTPYRIVKIPNSGDLFSLSNLY